MAKDVEYNYTASDKTGPASESVRRRMKQTGEDVKRQSDKLSSNFAKGIVDLAEAVSPKLASTLTEAFASTGEVGPGLLVAGVVASAPLIGATISGAIIGAAGLGGVVGGFTIAAKDPRVQNAFAGMKTDIGNELKDAAEPFVATSIKGISEIGNAVKGINFKQIFADSAKNAAPLIDGVTTAVEELGAAVENLIHNSGPVLTEIGHEIGAFGGAVADGLNSLSDNGKEGAEAFHQLFMVVNGTVTSVFALVNGLTEVYSWLDKISGGGPLKIVDELAAGQAKVADKTRGMAEAFARNSTSIDQYGQAVLTTGDAIQTFTSQVDDLAASGRSLFDSTTNVGESIDRFREALKKNGKTLDENTEKGRANRTALSNLAGALVAQYDATVKANGEGIKSNEVAATNRASFIRLATQMGLSKKAAEALATQMGLIPAKKNTDFYANTHDAEARIQALKDKISDVHGKTVDVIVRASVSQKVQNTLDRFGGTFAAQPAFAFAGAGSVVGRSEPARQPMSERLDNYITVNLDGSAVYTTTARQVRARSNRDAFRQRVGKR